MVMTVMNMVMMIMPNDSFVSNLFVADEYCDDDNAESLHVMLVEQ